MSTWRHSIGLLFQASLLTAALQARPSAALNGGFASTPAGADGPHPRAEQPSRDSSASKGARFLETLAALEGPGESHREHPSTGRPGQGGTLGAPHQGPGQGVPIRSVGDALVAGGGVSGRRWSRRQAHSGSGAARPAGAREGGHAMARRAVKEDAAGARAHHHSHFDVDACMDREEVAQDAGLAGKKPMSDYCTCAPGQNKLFSSRSVKERFLLEHGGEGDEAKGKGARGPSKGGMKFLMLAMEAEQLTKGRIHLAEAMLVSKILNRTLVLPNAGNSRVGYDRALPVCTYFDTAKIGEYVDWVAPEVLVEGLLGVEKGSRAQESLVDAPNLDAAWGPPGSAPVPPVKVVVLVLMGLKQTCDRSLWGHFYPKEGAEKHPLTYAVLRAIDSGDVVCVEEKVRRFVQRATVDLMKALKSDKVQDATVVLAFKTGSNMFFDLSILAEPDEHVVFAPHLIAATNTMVQMHMSNFASAGADDYDDDTGRAGALVQEPPRPSFLAVQWRAEYALMRMKTDSKLVERCVKGLVSTAKHVLDSYELSVVFLAADITADGESTSSSFQLLSENLQKGARHAIKEVYDELDPKSWSSLEPFFSYLDNGIQGILDKIVCMRAPVFMYGPRPCGGAYSSFTGAIRSERHRNRKKWPYFEWNLPEE